MPEPLESLTILNNEVACCSEGPFCNNGPSHSIQPKCPDCRLSPNSYLGTTRHYWKSIDRKHYHPVLEKEKRDAKRRKTIEHREAEKAKDPARKARQRAAQRAERRTNAEIIKSTRNSGRLNRDGDHLFGNNVVIDTKLQSTATNPVVHLYELDKVRADAKRNGRYCGILCIRNKSGRAIIAIDASDFAALVSPARAPSSVG